MIQNRTVRLFGTPDAPYLLIQPTDPRDEDGLNAQTAEIARLANVPFCLAAFAVDWNRELSPWEAPPVFGSEPFGNGAEALLAFLEHDLVPALGKDARACVIGGYSLAGFFALWAAYCSDMFQGAAAVSPSVWFPGWEEFREDRKPKAQHIYLSLGDREERTKHPVMKRVGDAIRAQYATLLAHGTDSVLEWNPGNHFQNADLRTAKGFAWLLQRIAESEKENPANERNL